MENSGFMFFILLGMNAGIFTTISLLARGHNDITKNQFLLMNIPLVVLFILAMLPLFFDAKYQVYEVNIIHNDDNSIACYYDPVDNRIINMNEYFRRNFSKEVKTIKIKRRSSELQGILPSNFYSFSDRNKEIVD